jgi:hypothetical protein
MRMPTEPFDLVKNRPLGVFLVGRPVGDSSPVRPDKITVTVGPAGRD